MRTISLVIIVVVSFSIIPAQEANKKDRTDSLTISKEQVYYEKKLKACEADRAASERMQAEYLSSKKIADVSDRQPSETEVEPVDNVEVKKQKAEE